MHGSDRRGDNDDVAAAALLQAFADLGCVEILANQSVSPIAMEDGGRNSYGSGKIQQPDARFDGRPLRKQLRILREFVESLDFVHMQKEPPLSALGQSGLK
jgi:hypothetical protein